MKSMQFLDIEKQHKKIREEIDSAVKRVIDSSVFIGGKEVEDFEKRVADFCNVKYAVGVNSGTDALYLSLKALGIVKGDEVITTPFTFIATAEVISELGAKPVFVDIDEKTFNINPDLIKVTEKTKAILPVDLFGQVADMDKILDISKNHRLYVVEDACQAIGAEYKGKKSGSMSDVGCFSFFPSKNLGALGDGGMAVTNDKDIADNIRLFRNHGSSPSEKYLNIAFGRNSRLDSIQAAILNVKLNYLDEWNKERMKIAKYYNDNLNGVGDIVCPLDMHIFNQYTIRTKHRDGLRAYLKENNIPTMIYYPLPLHLQPVFEDLGYKKGDFPEAERAANEVLSLPIYPGLENQDSIIEAIKNFFK